MQIEANFLDPNLHFISAKGPCVAVSAVQTQSQYRSARPNSKLEAISNSMSDVSDKFAAAWVAIKKKAGACAANTDLEDLKAAVQLGQKRVDQALKVGYFLQQKSGVFDKLSKANEGLGKIG